MLLKTTLTVATLGAVLTFAACSNDKPATDPVAPTEAAAETPAAPPAPPAGDLKTDPIYFGFDDYTLNADAQAKLTAMADALKASKSAAIQIQGHCDERGTIEYNLALGERRAQSVKNFLSQLGVESARLSTISFGEEKPVAEGHSEDAWSKNRRAEFAVTQN